VLQGSPSSIRALPEAVRHGVVQSFANSIHTVFVGVVPLAAAGFLTVLFLKEAPLRETSALDLLVEQGLTSETPTAEGQVGLPPSAPVPQLDPGA
jgi:hypothetical protein